MERRADLIALIIGAVLLRLGWFVVRTGGQLVWQDLGSLLPAETRERAASRLAPLRRRWEELRQKTAWIFNPATLLVVASGLASWTVWFITARLVLPTNIRPEVSVPSWLQHFGAPASLQGPEVSLPTSGISHLLQTGMGLLVGVALCLLLDSSIKGLSLKRPEGAKWALGLSQGCLVFILALRSRLSLGPDASKLVEWVAQATGGNYLQEASATLQVLLAGVLFIAARLCFPGEGRKAAAILLLAASLILLANLVFQ